MTHSTATLDHSEISGLAMDGAILMSDCIQDDSEETRDQMEWLEIAATMRQLADKLERIARREMDRDVNRENLRHEKARNIFRTISAINEGLESKTRQVFAIA